jgi:branched-chain amino acid aminotransferase
VSLAYHDGRLEPEEAAVLSPRDAGFLFGDGLFETLRVDRGEARDVAAHLDRLERGLARIALAIPESRRELEAAIAAVAEAAPRPIARLRLTITRGTPEKGPTRRITAAPYAPPSEGCYQKGVAAIRVPEIRLDSGSPLAGLKSLSYQAQRLAFVRAEAAGAFEALLANERGMLMEGSRSNLVAVLPEGILTPPESDGCLPGTVRRRLLESGAVREGSITPEDLLRAEGIYLTSSLIGVLPIGTLDGRPLPIGPEGGRLRRLLAEPPVTPAA